MHSQSPHPETTPVVRNVRSRANHHNQPKRGPSGNSQHPTAMRRVFVLVSERDSSQGESSVHSTIQGQHFTLSSSLNSSRVADVNQCVTSTPTATQRRSINTPTTTLGTSSRSTPAPGGTSTHRVVSSPTTGIVITPTPLRGLEILPTPSIIQKPAQSLQIHSERQLLKRIRDRGSGNCNRRLCLHLDQWSPADAACIELVTQT
jgi:hypothetical protein